MAQPISRRNLIIPRILNRETAAAYISVSPTTFDLMVKDGKMPQPRVLTQGRLGWDVHMLDAAIDALPLQGETLGVDHTWDDPDAAQTASIR